MKKVDVTDDRRIRGRCAACGLPGHRYGTTDQEHKYSATACINGLTFELGVMSEVAMTLARCVSPELATLLVAETIHDEKQRIYALHSFTPAGGKGRDLMLTPDHRMVALVAEALHRYSRRRWWQPRRGPIDYIPLAREVVATQFLLPDGQRLVREITSVWPNDERRAGYESNRGGRDE